MNPFDVRKLSIKTHRRVTSAKQHGDEIHRVLKGSSSLWRRV